MTDEQISRHEAGHCAAALLLGIEVRCLARWENEGEVKLHYPQCEKGVPREKLLDHLLMLLCGWIMEDHDLPDWPPSPGAFQPDERNMAKIVDALEFSQAHWLGTQAAAYWLTCSQEFCDLFEAITGLHERLPVLGDEALIEAERIALRTRLDREV